MVNSTSGTGSASQVYAWIGRGVVWLCLMTVIRVAFRIFEIGVGPEWSAWLYREGVALTACGLLTYALFGRWGAR
jgi:hypothetical protein